jgi:DNA gyrase subunit A
MLIEEEMKESYLRYAMSVIVARALPDVRDGLKPSQRRVLLAMHDLNLGPRSKHKKCAKIAGDCSGNYHPHGEAVVYPTLVRLAQDFNMRQRLVDPQGNFGSMDGDPPAAMRYTEARMTQASVDMMEDLERATVDLVRNYDDTRDEPTVLPAKFPNLLVNGAQGIAVGMATSIPPHNLREIGSALVRLIDRPECTIDDLLEDVQGPDFPTGGTICGRGGILQGYKTGRGKVIIRAKHVMEEMKRGKEAIVVTEIPYQVNKAELVKRMADLVNEGKIEGITDIRDESDKDHAVRVVIELKASADPQVILNQLYKHTQLQTSFSLNMIALVAGRPEVLNLKQLLESYRDHRIEVIRRRTQFLLEKAEERKHIVEGLRIAVDHIDEVIKTIREAATPEAASTALQARFGLSARQADAILAMQLRKLTGLEREKLEEEYRSLLAEIADLRDILARKERVLEMIKSDVAEMVQKYGDERRTDVSLEHVEDIDLADLIPEALMAVSVSNEGYIKRTPLSAYRSQGRGGKGVSAQATKEGDFMAHLFVASTHDSILFFTNLGRVYSLKVYELPEMARTTRGRALVNVIQMQEGEKVTSMIPVRLFDEREICMVTEQGTVKKTALSAFASIRKTGIVAVTLDEGDRLVDAKVARPEQEVFLGTREGQAIRFPGSEVRAMGRVARGVRGIRLREGDKVVSMALREPGASLLTVSEFGYGKRTEFDEYRETARGGIGVINIRATERNGKVVAILAVTEGEEIIVISQQGQLIRTSVAEIREVARNTQGVRVMRLDEGDRVVAVSRAPKEEISEDEEKRAREEAEKAAAQRPAVPPPEGGAEGNGDGAEEDEGGADPGEVRADEE